MAQLCFIGGMQWGYECKGKIIDFFSGNFDLAAKYGHGHDSRHNCQINGKHYVYSMLPLATVRGIESLILPSSFVELNVLINEAGSMPGIKFTVDERCCVVMDYHIQIDAERRMIHMKPKFNSKDDGIGPAFESFQSGDYISVGDLLNRESLKIKYETNLEKYCPYLASMGSGFFRVASLKENMRKSIEEYLKKGEILRKHIGTTNGIIKRALVEDKDIIFEGSYGTLLDPLFGLNPDRTHSSTMAVKALECAGLPPQKMHKIGVTKAYMSRNAVSPFPTKIDDIEILKRIIQQGDEQNSDPWVPKEREVGWLDFVLFNFADSLNQYDEIALTKLDALAGLNEIKICIAYRDGNGRFINEIDSMGQLIGAEPVYETFEGFPKIENIHRFKDLHPNARKLVDRISDLTNDRLSLISIGPERDQMIRLF